MSLDEHETKKKIANLYSMVLPGAGLIYLEKWLIGILLGGIHLVMLFLISWEVMGLIIGNDGTKARALFLIVYLIVIAVNWLISFMLTRGRKVSESVDSK